MTTENYRIDPYLFERQFEAFREFVEEQAGVPFVSFASHPYTEEQEGYKYEIYRIARDKLVFQAWKDSDIGSGEILAAVIDSIEFQKNNLVQWQSRYGDEKRPQHPLYEAENSHKMRREVENVFFNLYHESNEAELFSMLVETFGKKYALLAYFYFIKDCSKYLPLAPNYIDRAFELLGVDFKTSRLCSWENYSIYITIVSQIKTMLSETMSTDVTLLDAHSFVWMLSAQMESEDKLADVEGYLGLSSTEREAIIKSRIGQGQFRESLISYWSVCAVTGCGESRLLRASHIKPWSKSEVIERLSLYNGLLLSPALDASFDSGLLSFDDSGNIMISNELSEKDMLALGIHKEMKLAKIEKEHKKYLAYHREYIFRKS